VGSNENKSKLATLVVQFGTGITPRVVKPAGGVVTWAKSAPLNNKKITTDDEISLLTCGLQKGFLGKV
jgi:hypothetical protein